MFGLPPELTCPACARGIRDRMQVRVRSVRSSGTPYVTYGILGIAVALFLLQRAAAKSAGLSNVLFELQMGPGIWDGEVWRLLSSCLLHGGVIHIFFNCWWILVLGRATEQGFGWPIFVLLFVTCGMVGGGLEWAVNGPAVGLSGVVYGLALFLFVHRRTNPSAAMVMNQQTFAILALWFVICIPLTMSGTWNIANWAHGGGAVCGLAFGKATFHARRKLLVPAAVLAVAVLIFLTTAVAFGRQADARKIDRLRKRQGATSVERRETYWYVRSRRR
jgi:membrane associated rhomboid family serine protease